MYILYTSTYILCSNAYLPPTSGKVSTKRQIPLTHPPLIAKPLWCHCFDNRLRPGRCKLWPFFHSEAATFLARLRVG